MTSKTDVRARLEALEEMSGVLPTARRSSEQLEEMAQGLESNDMSRAVTASRAYLDDSQMSVAPRDTAHELFEAPEMRSQAVGFARAGISFYHADESVWAMSQSDRRSMGGNPSVTRVMVQGERLLLETSRIVVRTAEGASEADRDTALARHGVTGIGGNGLPPSVIRANAPQENATLACLALMEEDAIAYAEPDFIEHIGQRFEPNDPDLATQWHHANIASRAAWDNATGNGIRVSVVDNGFDTKHPDLAFGVASGWFRQTSDFVDADFVPGTANMPDEDHGTACAGMIAAVADNATGGCGVAFGADLSMIACAPDQIGTQATLARAIAYAADPSVENSTETGADVIACSLGPNGAVWVMSAVLNDALNFAAQTGRGGLGCPIFWACTNGNHPIGSDQVCSHPEVMAVGRATDGDFDNGSGFGPKLEFLAPGVNVWIPSSGGGYSSTTGTSFAAPCAAGIGALVLEAKPDLTAHELRDLIRDTCDKVGPLPYHNGHNIRYGHGRASAEHAVAEARRLATGF